MLFKHCFEPSFDVCLNCFKTYLFSGKKIVLYRQSTVVKREYRRLSLLLMVSISIVQTGLFCASNKHWRTCNIPISSVIWVYSGQERRILTHDVTGKFRMCSRKSWSFFRKSIRNSKWQISLVKINCVRSIRQKSIVWMFVSPNLITIFSYCKREWIDTNKIEMLYGQGRAKGTKFVWNDAV